MAYFWLLDGARQQFVWLVLGLLGTLCAYFFFPVSVLTVESLSGETKGPIMVMPLCKGDEFTIRYVHSVDKLPVYETFLVGDEGRLLLSEVKFLMLSAGMTDTEGDLTFEDGWAVVRNINREVCPFLLRVVSIAEQTLFLGNRIVKLSEIASESTLLKFEIKKRPRAYLMLARKT